jgi:hypothetical protein
VVSLDPDAEHGDKEPIVSRPISRTGTGSRRCGSSGAVTAPAGGGLAAGAGGLDGVVQADAVQGLPGDLLGAVHDGLDGGAALSPAPDQTPIMHIM